MASGTRWSCARTTRWPFSWTRAWPVAVCRRWGARAGLHADVRALLAGLAERVLALEDAYDTYKTERGLLDYTDLEVLFLRILEDESLVASLREEIQLAVVDEFQDTNPIQLALFLRLREIAERSIWVGDPKQAIYGFRGADAGLVDAAWRAVEDAEVGELPSNYRSRAGPVRIVGELFARDGRGIDVGRHPGAGRATSATASRPGDVRSFGPPTSTPWWTLRGSTRKGLGSWVGRSP